MLWIRKYFFRIRIRPDPRGQLTSVPAGFGSYQDIFDVIEKKYVVE
jgi:hypothetical protein